MDRTWFVWISDVDEAALDKEEFTDTESEGDDDEDLKFKVFDEKKVKGLSKRKKQCSWSRFLFCCHLWITLDKWALG